VSIGEEGIVSDVPIVSNAPVIAGGGIETNSQAIFNDLVEMEDETYIQGLDVVPHQVQVLGSFSAGGDKLHMLPLEISVLANHGNPAPSAISFALSASTQNQNVVTAVPWTATTSPYLTSVSTTPDTVTVPTHAQVVALSPITYVTQAVGSVTATTSVVVGGLNVSINASAINIVTGGTFNPATCLLSLTSSSVDVVHSISITTSPATVVTAISTAAAPTETKNNIGQSGDAVLAGGSPQILVGNVASATSPAVNFVGITASTSAITYATGGTIVVSAG
jgi:hypothetical protein